MAKHSQMTARSSTGFVSKILGPLAFDEIFKYGCIEVYSGQQPASADFAVSGQLLARISASGGAWAQGSSANGLRFVRTGRYAANAPDQVWKLQGIATGTAGWCRLRANAADSADYSTALPRIDGAVGLEDDADDIQLVLPTVAITPTTSIEITQWFYAIPPLGA